MSSVAVSGLSPSVPENPSGLQPVEYKVLVRLDVQKGVEQVSEGGIVLATGQGAERERMAQIKGTLVAVGHNAFIDWKWKPPVGARVLIAKHVGHYYEGVDGVEYRLCNDKDVAAVVTKEKQVDARLPA